MPATPSLRCRIGLYSDLPSTQSLIVFMDRAIWKRCSSFASYGSRGVSCAALSSGRSSRFPFDRYFELLLDTQVGDTSAPGKPAVDMPGGADAQSSSPLIVSKIAKRTVAIACVCVLACVDSGVLVEVDMVEDFGLRRAHPGCVTRARRRFCALNDDRRREGCNPTDSTNRPNSGIQLAPDSALRSHASRHGLCKSRIDRAPFRMWDLWTDRRPCIHRNVARPPDILVKRQLPISRGPAVVLAKRICMGPSVAFYLKFPCSG